MKKGRKSVLFLITKAAWGGAQRYVFDIATHLPAEKFEVALAYGQAGKLSQVLQEKNIRTFPLPALSRDVALFSDMQSFFQILALLRHQRPDVLHVNSSKASALGALAARISGVPRIIFTAHGWPFKEDRNFLGRAAIYCISWFTAALAHATIVVSRTDERIGKRMWLAGNKIHCIPLAIDTPQFLSREEARSQLSRRGLDNLRVPSIVTIAELTNNKGIRYAIDAVALLKNRGVNVEYFVIGDGELRAALEQQAREQNVSDRVHFLGAIDNAAQYLKACDLFVLPSIKEGMPYVLLEAAAAGLPIVATNAVDGYTTLAGDASALSLAIEGAMREPRRAPDQTSSLRAMIGSTAALY